MPVGFRIASAWVEIHAEDKGLRKEVEAAVKKAVQGVDAKVDLKINTKGLRKEVQEALKQATAGSKPMVDIGIRSTGLRREVQEALKRATAGNKPTVRLGISSSGLRAEVVAAVEAATQGTRGSVEVDVDINRDRIAEALSNVPVNPEFDLQAMRRNLRDAMRGERVEINPLVHTSMMRLQIEAEMARLRDRFRVNIHPDVDVSTLAARLQAAARTISHDDIEIDFNPNINNLRRRFQQMRERIPVNMELGNEIQMRAQVAMAIARLNAMGRNLHFRATIEVDHDRAMAAFRNMEGAMSRLEGHTSRLTKMIGAGIAFIPPAIAASVHAIETIGPAFAAVIPMITMAGTALATLAVGGNNVFKAIGESNDNLKQFRQYVDSLTPAARDFVFSVVTLSGAFKSMQLDVQEALFSGLAETMRGLGKSVIPDMRIGLGGMAINMNEMTKGVGNTLTELSKMGTLKQMFGAVKYAMDPLVPIPGQFTNAMVKMTIAATPLLRKMTEAWGRGMDSMTESINRNFENGRLELAINKSGESIKNFFKNIANNPEWQNFVARMQETGPRMAQAFADISEALLKLLNAAAPVTEALMAIVTAFAHIITAVPTAVLTALLAKLLLFKVVMTIASMFLKLEAAILLVRGAMGLLASQSAMVAVLTTRLTALGMTAPMIARAAMALRALGIAGVVGTGIYLLLQVMGSLAQKVTDLVLPASMAAVNVDKLSASLIKTADSGKLAGEGARVYGKDWSKLGEAIKEIAHPNLWDRIVHGFDAVGNVIGMDGGFLKDAQDKVKGLDDALKKMVQDGDAAGAARLFDLAAQSAAKNGTSVEKLKTLLPGYTGEVKKSEEAMRLVAQSMGLFGAEAAEVQRQLDGQKRAAEGLRQSLIALNDAHRAAMGGEIAMEQAISDANAALKENGRTLDVSTQAGRDNKKTLLDLAAATDEYVQQKIEETGTVSAAMPIYERGRGQLMALASQYFSTKEEAAAFVDEILRMPTNKTVIMDADLSSLGVKLAEAQTRVDSLKQQRATAVGADATALDVEISAAQKTVDSLKQQQDTIIRAQATQLVDQINQAQAKVDSLKQARDTAIGADRADLTAEVNKAQAEVDALKQKAPAALKALDSTGPGVGSARAALASVKDKLVTITTRHYDVWTNSVKPGPWADGLIPHARGGKIGKFARGGQPDTGFVSGPGGPTDDKIMAMLSNGEYVIRASSVKKYGAGFMSALNNGRLKATRGVGLASGGAVGSQPSYTIKWGDTLSELAVRFKTTVKELMSLNKNIKNANLIYAGQTLNLPDGGAGTGPSKPSGPNQGLPPYVWPALSKFSSGLIESTDKLSDMREWVTLSAESMKAGYVNAEAFHAINAGENMADLLKGIFEMKQKIRDTFKGSGETVLMDRMDLASDALIKWQAKLDPVNTSLSSAKEKLDSLSNSFTQMKDSVKNNVMDSGKITKIGKWGTNPQTLLNQLQSDVGKAGAFAQQLEQLKAKGINAEMIQQVAEAGISGGGAATAGSLLRMTPEQIAQLNSLQTQLTANADKAGTAAANAMYGAGLQAAQGLVAGLEANKKAIEDAMAKIAHAMEDSIKQALGIKSPSRVMMGVADYTADGLVNQLYARKDEANQAIRALVPGQIDPTQTRAANFGVETGTMGSASPTTVIHEFHVHIDGTFDLSKPAERRNIASALVVEMKEAIRVDDKRRR